MQPKTFTIEEIRDRIKIQREDAAEMAERGRPQFADDMLATADALEYLLQFSAPPSASTPRAEGCREVTAQKKSLGHVLRDALLLEIFEVPPPQPASYEHMSEVSKEKHDRAAQAVAARVREETIEECGKHLEKLAEKAAAAGKRDNDFCSAAFAIYALKATPPALIVAEIERLDREQAKAERAEENNEGEGQE